MAVKLLVKNPVKKEVRLREKVDKQNVSVQSVVEGKERTQWRQRVQTTRGVRKDKKCQQCRRGRMHWENALGGVGRKMCIGGKRSVVKRRRRRGGGQNGEGQFCVRVFCPAEKAAGNGVRRFVVFREHKETFIYLFLEFLFTIKNIMQERKKNVSKSVIK